jgi:hypothetical protein
MNGGPGLSHAEISARGGKSRSAEKLAASMANLRRAQQAQAAKRAANGEHEARAHPVKK